MPRLRVMASLQLILLLRHWICWLWISKGLDQLDRRYLSVLSQRFHGGPAGVEALAAAMAEDRGTLEDVIEPYLLQQGYIQRTSKGRIISDKVFQMDVLE